MRKYYSMDLNTTTNFINKKRHKDDGYFFECIREYIDVKFPEFKPDIQDQE